MTLAGAVLNHGNRLSWPVVSFRTLFHQRKISRRPELPLLGVDLKEGVRLRAAGDGRPAASEDLSAYKFVRVNDVVMNRLGKPHGSVGVSNHSGITSPAYWVLEVDQSLAYPRFIHYLLRSRHLICEYERLGKSMPPNQFDISWDAFQSIAVPMPPLPDQQRIANYLDSEILRLAELARRYQSCGLLLTERMGVQIELAMSPFERKKLRPLLSLLRDGTHQPPPRVDEGYPLLSVRNIIDGNLVRRPDDSFVSPKDFRDLWKACPVVEGDVVLAIVGATLGKAAVVGPMEPFCIQRSLAVLRPDRRRLVPRFLLWALRAREFQDSLWLRSGFSAQPGVYLDTIANLRIPLPPVEEQYAVVENLDLLNEETGRLNNYLGRQQDLLFERRQSLITAAVTGQIDVTTAQSVDA